MVRLRYGYSVKWAFIIIVITALVFLIQLSVDPGSWYWFTFTQALALEMPWIFVTSIFLHGGFTHLIFNMFALLTFGTSLERIVGGRRFLTVFFAAGIVGNLGYLVTSSDPRIPAIGASGAIFGVIGLLTVLRPWQIVFVGGLPMPLLVAALIWALLDLSGLTDQHRSWGTPCRAVPGRCLRSVCSIQTLADICAKILVGIMSLAKKRNKNHSWTGVGSRALKTRIFCWK